MDLIKILKNAPDGVELYSPICGPCTISKVANRYIEVISKREGNPYFCLDKEGKHNDASDCLLWPSVECDNWNNYQHVLFKEGHIIVWNGIVCKIVSIDEENTKVMFCDKNTKSYYTQTFVKSAEWADKKDIEIFNNNLKETLENELKNRINFQPFDKVLVRDGCKDEKWCIDFFSYIDEDSKEYSFVTISGWYAECVPYNEDTKHLLGTTEDAPKEYVT